jgi:arylsulfatase A-like enzyme
MSDRKSQLLSGFDDYWIPMTIALIVLDATRKDALGPYGAPRGATPNVDRLAADGVTFTNCFSGAPWTPASHATMFTGRYPSQHEARADDLQFPADGHWLPETLSAARIRTRGIGAEPWLSRRQGFDRGFDDFHDTGGHEWTHYLPLLPAGLGYGIDRLRDRFGTDRGRGRFNLHLFRQWAKRSDSFTFINISVAHGPYHPPEVFRQQHDVQPETDDSFVDEQPFYRYIGGEVDVDEAVWDDVRERYAAGVTHADYLLGRALDALDDDTWVIFTADHGEHLGEAGLAEHQFSLRDELVNVPLVVSHSSLDDRVEDCVVSHVDIAPTIYDIARRSGVDVSAPPTLPGRSLLGDGPSDRIVFAEYGPPVVGTNALINNCDPAGSEVVDQFFVGLQAAMTDRFKYVRRTDGTASLYERRDETTDVAADHPAVAEELLDAMDDALDPLPDVGTDSLDEYVDASVEDRLEDLGYL